MQACNGSSGTARAPQAPIAAETAPGARLDGGVVARRQRPAALRKEHQDAGQIAVGAGVDARRRARHRHLVCLDRRRQRLQRRVRAASAPGV